MSKYLEQLKQFTANGLSAKSGADWLEFVNDKHVPEIDAHFYGKEFEIKNAEPNSLWLSKRSNKYRLYSGHVAKIYLSFNSNIRTGPFRQGEYIKFRGKIELEKHVGDAPRGVKLKIGKVRLK